MTEDGFRSKFRSAKPEQTESAPQFATRLENYLIRWVELAAVTKNFAGLSDLLIREQFVAGCNKDMALFLKERKPKNVAEMTQLAEQYIEARGGWNASFGGHIAKDCYRRTRPTLKAASLQGSASHGHKSGKQGKKLNQTDTSSSLCTACSCESCGQNRVQTASACVLVSNEMYGEGVKSDDAYVTMSCGHKLPLASAACSDNLVEDMPVVQGFLGNKEVQVMRDSGCDAVAVRKRLVPEEKFTGVYDKCRLIDGTVRTFPVACLDVDTPYFTGHVHALVMNDPVYDLIVGNNLRGVREPKDPDPDWKPHCQSSVNTDDEDHDEVSNVMNAVQTRSQKVASEKLKKALKVPKVVTEIISADELQKAQADDSSLNKIRELAESGEVKVSRCGGTSKFVCKDGILFREFQSPSVNFGKSLNQVVVPQPFRMQVMKLAHETLLGGHAGVNKTTLKVLKHFFWPGAQADIGRLCRSCDICQRTFPKGRVTKVPLGSMPIIDVPFSRIAMDLVGPIFPSTERGHRFILTVMDYATRFPEAVPLRNIDSISVAEALLDIYSRVGFPREVLSDQGRQFTSEVMAEVNRLLSIRQLTTTAWHPMTNGMCERFNGVLKASLRKMCEERPRDWDRYINALLFAYRETPHASTGFSPFDLLYGRSVRGPLGMLKEFWTGQIEEPETKTTFEYVLDLQDRLQKTCDLAREEMKKSQGKYKMYYDRKAKARKFDVGDEVLLLLPTDHNKLLLHWKGPFPVVGKVGSMDYKVDFGTKVKTFHANLLKKYFRRDTDQPSKAEETIADVHINQDLTEEQSLEVKRLLGNYSSVLTDKPGFTHLGSHDIKLTDSTPVRTKPYPIPYALRDSVKEEIKTMLELDVIEPSTSPYASPLVVVKKADGKNRICCDTRKINAITEFDAEGIPSPQVIFDQLGDAQYFSKLDLSKGYWQVPLTENAKPLTVFLAFDQLYQYRRMPFGLVNAPATFSRIMRKLLNNFDKVVNYIDDILVYTVTWEEHLEKLNELMKRLRDANLTAKPSKCYIGFERVEFLGHTVEKGCRHPNLDKLEVIQKAPRPVTKTQLKSFLGLAGFYRQYIPNFGAIAVPLTDKTKAGEPTKINWERSQELAFQTLKSMLGKAPILHLPDFHRQFILRTDASDVAIGAVLFQEFEGVKFPLAYLSKKLNKAQRGYAIMEKECLAVVWAIRKLELYLYGRDFVLETDHQPLLCVKRSKVANGRIMRWALSLQPYHYRIEAIKGSDNIGADYMSRISHE
ncbi:uncharacterized protein [Amphiura filiformis]|uniref:uncharacterized protein n=1 Tax=Amphiura filiformis TaxID=82378 RepID=UPI003B221E42